MTFDKVPNWLSTLATVDSVEGLAAGSDCEGRAMRVVVASSPSCAALGVVSVILSQKNSLNAYTRMAGVTQHKAQLSDR